MHTVGSYEVVLSYERGRTYLSVVGEGVAPVRQREVGLEVVEHKGRIIQVLFPAFLVPFHSKNIIHCIIFEHTLHYLYHTLYHFLDRHGRTHLSVVGERMPPVGREG